MTPPGTLRIAGFDLGVHLGCVAIDLDPTGALHLVTRHTIHVGEVVALDPPILRTRKNGTTWTQRTERIGGPMAARAAAREATAWAVSLGVGVAAVEWIGSLHPGSHSAVLHAGQVGQSVHDALADAGVAVKLYVRSTALALLRRFAVQMGAPVLPGLVKSRGAELTPVLNALVAGWEGSGPVVGRHVGAGTKEASDVVLGLEAGAGMAHGLETDAPARPAAGSREDRRPEHETDACAVALAHVAHLAGVTVHPVAKVPSAAGSPRVRTRGPKVIRRKPAEGCHACTLSCIPGPYHRRQCPQWSRVSAIIPRARP